MKITAPFRLVKHARQRVNKLRHRFTLYGNAGPAHSVVFLGNLYLGYHEFAEFTNYRPAPFKNSDYVR
jgi:hypothetical protein